MSELLIRPAEAGDLPALATMLPAWTLDTTSFADASADDCLLLACAGAHAADPQAAESLAKTSGCSACSACTPPSGRPWSARGRGRSSPPSAGIATPNSPWRRLCNACSLTA